MIEGFVWVRQSRVSPHDKRRNTMRMFEYVCRCRKRFESQFQLKRHVKYECSEKHIHREEFKGVLKVLGLLENRRRKTRRGPT
jgi:hypothetical protein